MAASTPPMGKEKESLCPSLHTPSNLRSVVHHASVLAHPPISFLAPICFHLGPSFPSVGFQANPFRLIIRFSLFFAPRSHIYKKQTEKIEGRKEKRRNPPQAPSSCSRMKKKVRKNMCDQSLPMFRFFPTSEHPIRHAVLRKVTQMRSRYPLESAQYR